MSIGFLTEEQTPMIWRGPMVTSAIKTFTQKVKWQDLDFIIVDMPPGTGDTQLTFAQEISMDGVIIVSTPQEIAIQDVKRVIRMFDKFNVNFIVSYLSKYMSLQPGDIITTGTPPGVGMGMKPQQFLKAGDTMKLSVENLGEQNSKVIAL